MKLVFKSGNCSLGFFATDSVGDQLAITAGHCALNEKVYNAWGQQIGEVVAWQPDAGDGNGKLTGSRGFTVVYTYKTFSIEAFFTRAGTAKIGDRVRLYGQRTSGTSGTVTNVSYTTGHPDLDLLTSDVAQLPGDSGGPLYTQGPTLVGIASSVNDATRGADAQPLESLEQEIKAGAGHYGRGFSVYISG
jgi:V8-like Glu-specific endopeptidase